MRPAATWLLLLAGQLLPLACTEEAEGGLAVLTVTPRFGSCAGGTALRIRCAGLGLPRAAARWTSASVSRYQELLPATPMVAVSVGGIPCDILWDRCAHDVIVCRTRPVTDGSERVFSTSAAAEGTPDLPVSLEIRYPGENSAAVAVGSGPNATFRYRGFDEWRLAPVIERVTPVSAYPGDEVTMYGRGIPSEPAYVDVAVGGVPAALVRRTPTSLVFRVPATLSARSYNVSFHVDGVGFAKLFSTALRVDRSGAIHALQVRGRVLGRSPSTGSAAGGGRLTIWADGVGPGVLNRVTVHVDGTPCAVAAGSLSTNGSFSCVLAESTAAQQIRRAVDRYFVGNAGASLEIREWPNMTLPGTASLREALEATELPTAEASTSLSLSEVGWDLPATNSSVLHRQEGWLVRPQWEYAGGRVGALLQLRLRVRSTADLVEIWVCQEAAGSGLDGVVRDGLVRVWFGREPARGGEFGSVVSLRRACRFEVIAIHTRGVRRLLSVEPLLTEKPKSASVAGSFSTVPALQTIQLSCYSSLERQVIHWPAGFPRLAALVWESRASSPFEVAAGNTAALQATIEGLAGAHCKGTTSDGVVFRRFDFEASTLENTTRDDAFCGRRSLSIRGRALQLVGRENMYRTKAFPYVCMAYKVVGTLLRETLGAMTVELEAAAPQVLELVGTGFHSAPAMDQWSAVGDWVLHFDDKWHSSCFDLDLLLDRRLGGQDHVIASIFVDIGDGSEAAMIDEFTIQSSNSPLTQTQPLGIGGIILDSVSVDANISVAGGIDWFIDLARLGCTGEFPLMRLNELHASRSQAANEALAGSFTVTAHSRLPVEIDISRNNSDDAIRNTMEQVVPGVVRVERRGCYNMNLHVELDPEADESIMSVTDCNLIGSDPTASIDQTSPGGYMMSDIPQDWVRTVERIPQVQVAVDGIPLECAGGCGFNVSGAGISGVVGVPLTAVLQRSTLVGDEECASIPGFVACRGSQCIPSSQRCLYVSSVSPNVSSVAGGQQLTITGGGFAASTKVDVGGTDCTVDSWNDNQVVCTIAHTSKVHVIANTGVHPLYGPGLQWDQPLVAVRVGDTVRWQWEPAWNHAAPLHRLVHSNTSAPKFRSSLSAAGTMQHVFTVPGMYHFASEYYADIGMVGSVVVTPFLTKSSKVKVVTGETLAVYSSPLSNQPLNQCGAKPAPLEDSVVPTLWPENLACGALGYSFEDCQGSCVPRGSCDSVAGCDDLSPRGAYTGCRGVCVPLGICLDRLHCEAIEEDRCAQLIRAEVLTCYSATEMGTVCALAVRCECLDVAPTACVDLIPKDPCASMVRGGYSCSETQSLGFSCAVFDECGGCEDSFLPNNDTDCDATVTSANVPEILLSSCVAVTPEVLAVVPSKSIPGDTISIMGHGFGNNPTVHLGDTECQTLQSTDLVVLCIVPDLPGGTYALSVTASNKGFAVGVFHVHVQAVVAEVTMLRASGLGGGETITIAGSGFSTRVEGAAVTVGNTPCTIVSLTSSEIVCTTSRLVDSGFAAAAIADGALGQWSLDSLEELPGSAISGRLSGLLFSVEGIGDKTPVHWQVPSLNPSYILTYDGSEFASLSVGGQGIVRQDNIGSGSLHGAPAAQFDPGSVLTLQPVQVPPTWSISVWFIGPLTYTGSPHCLVYGSDGSEHVYVPANLQDLGVITVSGSTQLQFVGSGAKLGRINDGWHHLCVVAADGTQKFFVDGAVVGTVEQQVGADIIAVGNKPSGTQPWGDINAFILYGTVLLPSQIAAIGATPYGLVDSGLLFTESATAVVPSIARSYGFSGELSIEFWVRKPHAFQSNNNGRRQMIVSGVDESAASINSGFVFWINPCGELEMWVRLASDGSNFHSGCVWPTLEELQSDAFFSSDCPTTGETCSLPEMKVGAQAWSVIKDPGFASTSSSSWVHVIGTYSGSTQSLFTDGDLIGSRHTGLVAPGNDQSVNLQLGGSPAWSSAGVLPFSGGLDEVALYSYLFNSADVRRHASYGAGAVQKLTVAFEGAPALCPNSACSAAYAVESTALLHSVSPSAGFGDAVLTLVGQALGAGRVEVKVGEFVCTILTSTDVEITCSLTTPTPGLYPIVATIGTTQAAVLNSQPLFFLHQPEVTAALPTTGSLSGGTVLQIIMRETLIDAQEVTVLLGDIACIVVSVELNTVECVSGSRSAPGTVAVGVFVNGIRAQGAVTFLYYTSSTPEIMTVAPSRAFGGDLLHISGRWFSPNVDENTVIIGGEPCTVQSCAADFIECTVGYKSASTDIHSVQVHVSGRGNAATSRIGQNSFQYLLAATSLSAHKVSFGGEKILVNGAGFCTTEAACTQVMVCEQICAPITSTYTMAECIIPPMAPPADGSELECDVTVTVDGVIATGPQLRVVFNNTVTPRLTALSPHAGSSGGDTLLHLVVSGLSPLASDISVDVGNAACAVEHVWHNDCTDVLEPFTLPSWPSPVERSCTELMDLAWDCSRDMSVVALNTLQPQHSGYSTGEGFLLRDQCTSSCARAQGTHCSVPNASQTESLLCRTSERAAADTSVSVHVSRKGIAATTTAIASFHYYDLWSTARTWDGGVFPEPGSSVQIPSTQIVLLDVVPPPLFSLVIDGGKLIFDRMDLTLNTSYLLIVNGGHLEIGTESNPFQHQCVISLFASHIEPSLPFFGTSGIALSDGIVDVHGSPHISWTRFRETSAAGATQVQLERPVKWQRGDTIVIGSSSARIEDAEEAQVQAVSVDGMTIALTQPLASAHLGTTFDEGSGCDSVHLSTEVGLINRNVVLRGGGVIVAPTAPGGATLRMSHISVDVSVNIASRHPIYIHKAGLVAGSYVSGCSIVATTGGIHSRSSHGLRVRGNVLVTSGDAILAEDCDGIVIQDNFAIACGQPDLSAPPRAMFIVFAPVGQSHIFGNAASGSTGAGFQILPPSFGLDTPWTAASLAPQIEFANNTAHSNANGLQVETLGSAAARLRLTVHGFTAYLNRQHGAVFQHGEVYVDRSRFLANSLTNVLVAHGRSLRLEIHRTVVQMRLTATSDSGAVVADGILVEYDAPLLLDDVQFVYFDHAGAASIRASHLVSEWKSRLSTAKLAFCSSPNRVSFAMEHQLLIEDVDGTLTGSPGWALPTSKLFSSLHCRTTTELSAGRHSGMACAEAAHIVRVRFRVIDPPHVAGHQATISNAFGSAILSYQSSKYEPYIALVPTQISYRLQWENQKYMMLHHIAGTVVGMHAYEYLVIEQTLDLEDVVVPHFLESFAFNETGGTLTVTVTGLEATSSTETTFEAKVQLCPDLLDVTVHSQAIGGCHVPRLLELSTNCMLWSSETTWPSGSVPTVGQDVVIANDMCVLLDASTPSLGRLTVRGDLQFVDNQDLTLTANHLRIEGGRVMAGSKVAPFAHRARLVIGAANPNLRSIEVYGVLQLVGLKHMTSWTKLTTPAPSGSSVARLQNKVDWGVGDEIVVTSGDENPSAFETAIISQISVDGKTLALGSSLQYGHTAGSHLVSGGTTVDVSAEVGLLSRRIKIEDKGSGGCGILVGKLWKWEGSVELVDVELAGCSGAGGTNPMIEFQQVGVPLPLRREYFRSSRIRACSFHSGSTTAIHAVDTSFLTVEESVILTTAWSAVIFEGVENQLKDTLGISVNSMPECSSGTCSNACASRPCQNGSPCVNVAGNNYFCACLRGWNGTDCESLLTDINGTACSEETADQASCPTLSACDGEPCLNGVCVPDADSTTGFFCACQTEFRGELCDVRIEEFHATFEIAADNVAHGNAAAGSTRAGFRLTVSDSCNTTPSTADLHFYNNTAHSNLVGLEIVGAGEGVECAEVGFFRAYRNWDIGVHANVRQSLHLRDSFVAESIVGVLLNVYGPDSVQHEVEDKIVTVSRTVVVGRLSTSSCAAQPRPLVTSFKSFAASQARVGLILSSFTQLPVRARDSWMAVDSSYPALSGGFFGVNLTFSDFGPSPRCPFADSSSVAIANNPASHAGHPHYFSGSSFVRNARGADLLFTPGTTDAARHSLVVDADGALGGGVFVPYADRGDGVEMQSALCTKVARLGMQRCPVSASPTHRMLVFESMDADTESRRIAPLTLSSSSSVDSLNGPSVVARDNTEAPLSRTLSTFFPIVAVGQLYNASFGGGSPFHCRLLMLHAVADDGILLQLNYSGVSERLDVYRSGDLVRSSGLETAGGLSERVHGPQHMPTLGDSPPGSNYYDDSTGQLHLLVKGPQPMEIVMAPVLKISLQLTAQEELSKSMFVAEFAAALRVDQSEIVIVRISEEGSGRRRQQTGAVVRTVTVEAEVGEQPSATRAAGTLVLAQSILALQSSLTSVAATLVSLVQDGGLAAALSGTGVSAVSGLQLVLPIGLDRTAPPEVSGSYLVQIPRGLEVHTAPNKKLELNENFTVAGVIKDPRDRTCTVLGFGKPWNLTASIKPGTGSTGATLSGEEARVANFAQGIASFEGLSIGVTGAGYVVALRASNGFYVETPPFDVGPVPVPFNPWQIVISIILVVSLWAAIWCAYCARRRKLQRVVPTQSLLHGIERISQRIATPDLHYLPRPDAFIGVPIQDLFTRDPTTVTTLRPTNSEPAMLEVEVIRARNLKRMDLRGFGKSDPFCVVEHQRVSHYTAVIDNNLNPVWSETFSFWVKDESKDLIITMFDKDSTGADLMGEVRFKLYELTPHAVYKAWHPLRKSKEMKKKETVKGDIQLAVRTAPRCSAVCHPLCVIAAYVADYSCAAVCR